MPEAPVEQVQLRARLQQVLDEWGTPYVHKDQCGPSHGGTVCGWGTAVYSRTRRDFALHVWFDALDNDIAIYGQPFYAEWLELDDFPTVIDEVIDALHSALEPSDRLPPSAQGASSTQDEAETPGDTCPHCEHPWDLHPVAVPIFVCVQCISDEDHQLRTNICEAVPPGLRHRPAADFLTATLTRSWIKTYRVEVTGISKPWIFLPWHLGWSSSEKAQAALASTQSALNHLPVMVFRSWFLPD